MPVQVTTRAKKDTVTLLSNVDVEFVSLVRHGANWTPFSAIKNDSGDSTMAGQVIQAILMPVDADIAALKQVYGDEWFARVRTDLTEKMDKFTRYTQRAEEDFEEFDTESAFKLADVPIRGAYFVCGSLKAEKADESALLMPTSPMQESVTETEVQVPVTFSFGEMFYNSLDTYESHIRSALELYPDTKKRLKIHGDAWKAVDQAVRAGIEKIANAPMKLEKIDPSPVPTPHKNDKPATDAGENITDAGGIDTMTKEEVTAIVTESMTSRLEPIQGMLTKIQAALEKPEKQETPTPETTPEEQGNAETELKATLDALRAEFSEFKNQLKVVAEKTEALEHATVGQTSGEEDPAAKSDDDEVDFDPSNPGKAFDGMFDRLGVH